MTRASVSVGGERVATIGPGLLILLAVAPEDSAEIAERMADRVRTLRIFDDGTGRMNEALGDREALCVSQFTLYADTRRGNRPSFTGAAPPTLAESLYDRFCEKLGARRGRFGARMEVELTGDGPVTVLLDSL